MCKCVILHLRYETILRISRLLIDAWSNAAGATVDESGRSSLLVENVTAGHAGTYVCVAENSVGAIRALSFVRIRGKQRLISEPRNVFFFICKMK